MEVSRGRGGGVFPKNISSARTSLATISRLLETSPRRWVTEQKATVEPRPCPLSKVPQQRASAPPCFCEPSHPLERARGSGFVEEGPSSL